MEAREQLIATLRKNSEEAAAWKSPLYAAFSSRMAEDVEAGGPTWELLERYAVEPPEEYYPFRALAGVHHMVLRGELPELARHYPPREVTAMPTRRGRSCARRSRSCLPRSSTRCVIRCRPTRPPAAVR